MPARASRCPFPSPPTPVLDESAADATSSSGDEAHSRQRSNASAAAASDDRSVRQRTNPVVSAAARASSSSSASATASASSPAPRLSLMRLAVVERQLIMQALDLTSLARLASTCRQMRRESLHKESGKFIPAPAPFTPVARQWRLDEDHPAHASPLFRMHAPVRLSVFSSIAAVQDAQITKASHFSRITALSSTPDDWTDAEVLQLLAQPWIQPVRRAEANPVSLRSSAVQHAFFSLPHLASVDLLIYQAVTDWKLEASALSLASKLTTATIIVSPPDAEQIRALRAAPSLTHLSLQSFSQNAPLGPLLCCLPHTLTRLALCDFSLRSESTSQSQLKTAFASLPLLHRLETVSMKMAPLLQGLVDAGASALPHLERVEFDGGLAGGDLTDLVPLFLSAFPAAILRLVTADRWATHQLLRSFGGWERVELDEDASDSLDNETSHSDNQQREEEEEHDQSASEHNEAAEVESD